MPGHPGELDVITLLIVDDHPVVRDGLAALIDTVGNVAVVAQADTAERAIRAAQALRPDVVLMDLNLPGASGIYATRRITQALPGTAVLVLTMSEDDQSIRDAIRAGARGYLLKGARQQEILTAIETVASGGALFSPHAARHLLAQLSQEPESPDVVPPFPELTVRERQVLELVGNGMRNHAVAQRLGISQKTVANYLSAIFVKLHVEDRAQAILLARQAGLAANPDKPRP
jgi:DNA-binding NarL/FixJ family response regulator